MGIRQGSYNDMPGTNFIIGRVSENFGNQDRVGGLVTIRNQPGGSNIETTADGFFRFGGSSSFNTVLTESYTTNTGKRGFGGIINYGYSSNQWNVRWTESFISKDFDPQSGFVSRKDIIGSTPWIMYFYRGDLLPFKDILLTYLPGTLPELYYTASTGKFTELDLPFFPVSLAFKNGGYFGYSIVPIRQHLTDTFQPLGVNIAPGDYSYFQQNIYIQSDPSKSVNVNIHYRTGSYYNGHINSGDWQLQFAPIPNISLMGEYNLNYLKAVGEQKTTTAVNLYILQARFALNPRVQLAGLYQKNSLNNSDSYNLRFSWEFAPLSYIYLIYNRGVTSMVNNTNIQNQTEDHLIAKISYLQQF